MILERFAFILIHLYSFYRLNVHRQSAEVTNIVTGCKKKKTTLYTVFNEQLTARG